MTNREKIAEMKVVDFYAKFGGVPYYNFTSFISKIINCDNCPNPCTYECSDCYKNINTWLDKECDD